MTLTHTLAHSTSGNRPSPKRVEHCFIFSTPSHTRTGYNFRVVPFLGVLLGLLGRTRRGIEEQSSEAAREKEHCGVNRARKTSAAVGSSLGRHVVCGERLHTTLQTEDIRHSQGEGLATGATITLAREKKVCGIRFLRLRGAAWPGSNTNTADGRFESIALSRINGPFFYDSVWIFRSETCFVFLRL